VTAMLVGPVVLAANAVDTFIQTFFRGAALGSLYALLALSFVLIFKATQTVNFAEGAMALAGTWFLSMVFVDWDIPGRWLGGPTWIHWFLAVVIAAGMTAAIGLVVERLTIRPLIGQPHFTMAMVTLGLEVVIVIIASDAVHLTPRVLDVPWGADSFRIGGAIVAWSYLAAIVMAGAAFLWTWRFFKSRAGVAMRATAFDQEAALAQGINVGRVFAISWGVGAAIAALSGIFASMAPWGPAGVVNREGALFVFRALPAVVLGGLDSVVGALMGGLIIGFAEVFAGQYLADHASILGYGYQQVVPYVVMLIGLLIRPYGMFGTEEVRRV